MYDRTDVVCDLQRTGSGPFQLVATYVQLPSIDSKMMKILPNGQQQNYVTDALGSVHMVTTAGGTVLNRTLTTAWGEVLAETGTTGERHTGLAQREVDEESGLQYTRARLYFPGAGRFMQVDPLNAVLQQYAYVGNRPLAGRDPHGLQGPLWWRFRYTDTGRFVHGAVRRVGDIAYVVWTTTPPKMGYELVQHVGRVRAEMREGVSLPHAAVLSMTEFEGPVGWPWQMAETWERRSRRYQEILGHPPELAGPAAYLATVGEPIGAGAFNRLFGTQDFDLNPIEPEDRGGALVDILVMFSPGFSRAAWTRSTVPLYRAVGAAELRDIVQTQSLRPAVGGVEGKYFATTARDAVRWGEDFYGTREPWAVVRIEVPTDFPAGYALSEPRMGPAVFFSSEQLQRLAEAGVQPRIHSTSPAEPVSATPE